MDSVDRLEVEVASAREWSRCPHCGFRCHKVWDRRAKRVRDLGVSGRRTTLVWRRRRFECGNCGERHLEDHAQFAGGLTRRFARRLVNRPGFPGDSISWEIMGYGKTDYVLVGGAERAVRMVSEHRGEHRWEWAAICSIAEKFGCASETLRKWVRRLSGTRACGLG